jgi:hypothetical protein
VRRRGSHWRTMASSRGGKKMCCVPEIDAEFIGGMEDVLELYARKYDPREPVVCLDERPVVLHADSRTGVEMAPHRIRRRDYEYVRGGTANVFCIVEPLTGRRLTFASANRKRPAFVRALQKIALRYHDADCIHVILDNLDTHSEMSAIKALGILAGRRLWRRFEIHYTPKHASWLNAAEIEAKPCFERVPRHRPVRLSRPAHLTRLRLARRRRERAQDHRLEVSRSRCPSRLSYTAASRRA